MTCITWSPRPGIYGIIYQFQLQLSRREVNGFDSWCSKIGVLDTRPGPGYSCSCKSWGVGFVGFKDVIVWVMGLPETSSRELPHTADDPGLLWGAWATARLSWLIRRGACPSPMRRRKSLRWSSRRRLMIRCQLGTSRRPLTSTRTSCWRFRAASGLCAHYAACCCRTTYSRSVPAHCRTPAATRPRSSFPCA